MGDRRYENKDINPESEELKDDFRDNCERDDEEKSFIDQAWESYTERPLLPLQPLQKSRSCTNLVQTIKGFSIRKTGTHKRYSSPEFQENTIAERKERCTSEANVSKDYRLDDVGMKERKIRSVSDATEISSQKNFAWYHPVDAREAAKRLLTMRQNGAFLIRPASNPTPENFHTLCVMFSGRVYNFHVRNLKNGYISLNRKGQMAFPSLLELIKYHQNVPISIHIAESDYMAKVLLLITPSK